MAFASILAPQVAPTVELPDLLIATHEVTWLAANYTNQPTVRGAQALTSLIKRLDDEAINVRIPDGNIAHLGTYVLAEIISGKFRHTQFDVLPKTPDERVIFRNDLSDFCTKWAERLRCWLDDNERLIATMQRYQLVIMFLQEWYSLECSNQVHSNRGHPRHLAEAGIDMPTLVHDDQRQKWVPVT